MHAFSVRPLRATHMKCGRRLGFLLIAVSLLSLAGCGRIAFLPQGSPPPASLHLGISYGETLTSLSTPALNATLDDAVRVGVNWIRMDFSWSHIQPAGPNQWSWSPYDTVISAAHARGLSILGLLTTTPAWARPPGCSSPQCAPANNTAFGKFAASAAQRYAWTGLHAWEIWNEPNMSGSWQPRPNVAQYAGLLKAAVWSLRATDPNANVISGSVGSTDWSGGNIPQVDFVTGLCSSGGAAIVDGIGYHPYSYPVPASYQLPWNAWQKIDTTNPSIEGVLSRCGLNKPVWATEYGAPTNGPGVQATPTNYEIGANPDHVDEALQAQMATNSVQAAAASTHIAALFWYTYRDAGTNTSDTEDFFGLRRFDGTAKPALSAYSKAIAFLRAAGRVG